MLTLPFKHILKVAHGNAHTVKNDKEGKIITEIHCLFVFKNTKIIIFDAKPTKKLVKFIKFNNFFSACLSCMMSLFVLRP